jgi:addiction module HigA family antidote
MLTKRRPVSVGEMLEEEFMKPMKLTQTALARVMGVERRLVNELCNDRRAVTVDTALMLARVFGNTPEFWLNVQRRNDLWQALNTPERRKRIERARPVGHAA